ncbi:MAG: HAMP domain-containing protein [Bifidobacteriaceae bacterium]|jgi:signal transduction histidine kinase|nr:HAMP domain-containing protein [Bifidobacteriaceae bacterium]
MRARRTGRGLTARLMLAFALVIGVAGVTAGVVAALVGPSAFRRHMVAAGRGEDETALTHAEAAFRAASGTALGIALAVAAAAALALSVLIARRTGAVAGQLARAARGIADGRFDARVAAPRLSQEFDALAAAFNEMAAALAVSERLRRRLLGDVAHELRTPVATINAHLEALEDGIVRLTPEVTALLRAQGERLTRLASDLAAVARAEDRSLDLRLARAPVGGILEGAALAARPAFVAKGVALVVDPVPDAVPPVSVDRARFAQVLGNLLDNALRHTPAGGRVLISAAAAPSEPASPGAGAATWPGPGAFAVRITVSDTGEGIPAEHLPHVFERFYRVDEARDRASGGAGIGLAIAKALAEAHGGRIAARSAGRGRGASFMIDLPAAV